MKIDSYSIKISSGKVNIEHELNLGDDLMIKLEGTITKSEDLDNQDGTIERVYTIKGIIAEASRGQTDKIFRRDIRKGKGIPPKVC